MIVEPIAAAEREVSAAVEYYMTKAPHVAERFLADFDQTVQRIVAHPNARTLIGRGLRRCLLTDFPYQVIYRIEGDVIRVYAIAHHKRRPRDWRNRVTP